MLAGAVVTSDGEVFDSAEFGDAGGFDGNVFLCIFGVFDGSG